QTFYPGASPEVMTSSVTAPLERQFGQMPGLSQMSSQSSAGASVITLQFSLELSLDIAEQEVQAAINAAGSLLPSDLPAPPIYAKINPADAPILTLALTSKTLPLTQVQDLADTRLAQKISQVGGVGLVSLSGGQRPAIRIQANPRALAAYGLNLDDLRTTISNLNVNTPKGNFDGPTRAYTINANDQLTDANAYHSAVVAYKNGRPVMLTDVAQIVSGPENTKLGAWVDSEPAIILNVQRQPGANVIQVVDNIKALLPQLRQSLPASVQTRVLTDRTTTIRASVRDVQFELAAAVVLVVLVMYLFLGSWQATVIPSLSVPLSLIGTLAVMYLYGFSLNNLSLMALTIATGHSPPKESGRFEAKARAFFDAVIAAYGRALTRVLDHQRLTLVVALSTLVLTIVLYVMVPKGFFPIQDTGIIQGITQASQSVSYAAMAEHQQQLAAEILKDPDVESLSSFIGVDGTNITLNSGRILINLKPFDERSRNAQQIIRSLQQRVYPVPGISLYMQPVQDLTIDSSVSATQYQLMLTDANAQAFAEWVPKFVARLKQAPELADVASDLQQNGLSTYIEIDRSTAARFGITPATVNNALYDAFGQRIISTLFTQSNQYRVILEADPKVHASPDALGTIHLPSATATGAQVPLSSIATFHQQSAPLLISHLGQFPSTTISFNLAPGGSLGAAVKAIEQAKADIGLPPSFQIRYQGAALAFQASLSNQ
ncbi:hypothetical protein DFQ30_002447, partial [Apophysomyces sp. BC1015]